MKQTVLAGVAVATMALPVMANAADPAAVARGKYLVAIAGCHDCHTPGYFLGKPLPIGQYAALVGRSAVNDVETARHLARA